MNTTARPGPAPADTRLGRLAGWSFTHRRRVLLVWVGALVIVTALSIPFHGIFLNKFGGGST